MNTITINPDTRARIDSHKINEKPQNKTLEGVLVNNYIKDSSCCSDFSEISDRLLITDKSVDNKGYQRKNFEQSFSMKNAVTPLLIGTAALFAGVGALSLVAKKASKALLNAKNFEKLPDLAVNMNIKQETHFAMYRILRDPSFKNIAGAGAVFLFSLMTLLGKNFVDGVKEIWIKKQQADIERDLQENLIDVETRVFKGKLEEVNRLLVNNVNYFKNTIKDDRETKAQSAELFFKKYFNFKGAKDEEKENKKSDIKFVMVSVGAVFAAILAGRFAFKNIRQALSCANEFTNKYSEKILDTIEDLAQKNDKEKLSSLVEMFKVVSAKPEYIKKTLKGLDVADNEIEKIIKDVEMSRKSLFTDAPTALGGIPKKIQYYCYLDEDRGHLYNWVVNPDNKFTKYIFLSFATISAVSYLIKEGFDALKVVAVSKENMKTELSLKERLAYVEIENFKAKKNVAIQPLVDNFDLKVKQNRPKQELKRYSENILHEIKNGPPYIYS